MEPAVPCVAELEFIEIRFATHDSIFIVDPEYNHNWLHITETADIIYPIFQMSHRPLTSFYLSLVWRTVL